MIEPRISSFALSKTYGLERRDKRKKDCGNQLPNDVATSTFSSLISLCERHEFQLDIVAKGNFRKAKPVRHALRAIPVNTFDADF